MNDYKVSASLVKLCGLDACILLLALWTSHAEKTVFFADSRFIWTGTVWGSTETVFCVDCISMRRLTQNHQGAEEHKMMHSMMIMEMKLMTLRTITSRMQQVQYVVEYMHYLAKV